MKRTVHGSWTAIGLVALAALVVASSAPGALAQMHAADVVKKLGDFDTYMEQTLKDWNAPGIGVGIVVGEKLVFAKGYGYRDYEKKLPFTPKTLCQIASIRRICLSAAVIVSLTALALIGDTKDANDWT
ncbi:MAG TPA: serine hydrolase domain-containing protein [Acidobacteriota bacterium]|nr:serine hydrolase domain-containing protein [Acidobacteriota bacterium]